MMKTIRLYTYGILACLLISFSSCTKDNTAEEEQQAQLLANCNALTGLKAHTNSTLTAPVTKGGTITLSADLLANANYFWSGPGNYQSYYDNNTLTTSATYGHRGWYYVRIALDNCNDARFDSVYVNVKFPQGTPSCTPANNTSTFSGPLILGTHNYSFISWGTGSSSGFEVTANSSNGDMTIRLNSYWYTHAFEDGIYYTTSTPTAGDDIDRVFISAVNNSIYWVAEPDKPVYISHSGSKTVITFCGIKFYGTLGGPTYTTTVNTKITQP